MNALEKKARIAGLLYLLIGVTAPIGLELVPSKLFVAGDAAATADRIRSSETLFRIGMASELFHQAVAIFLVLALYDLFKDVDRRKAVLVVILGALVSVPIMFANVLNEVAALTLAEAPSYLSVFPAEQLDALAYFFMRLHVYGIDVASVFWGLWLFPFGWLVIRCGFIPRIFGYLLIVAGIGYLAACVATFLFPGAASEVGDVAMILEIGEVPIILWLLIRGARVPRPAPA